MDSFVGEIRVFSFDWAPTDWACCNGQIAYIQQYTALFAIVATRYGGDGRTTFGLPNMQGYAPIGAGTGPGLTKRSMGQVYGHEGCSLTSQTMPSHDHGVTMKGVTTNYTSLTAAPTAGNSSLGRVVRPTSATTTTSINEFVPPPVTNLIPLADATCGVSGGSQQHENRQPFLAMNFCVSLGGIFPVNP
ncbi:MAG TPA: tail fiber protein [Magnetospirillum sp.]|nr:tail fiber protein [Magnetospirillum sp.]